MTDALDVDLTDPEQVDEIELLGELMALTARAADALDLGTIDAILGSAPGRASGQLIAG